VLPHDEADKEGAIEGWQARKRLALASVHWIGCTDDAMSDIEMIWWRTGKGKGE
jgi:hypothetical protein